MLGALAYGVEVPLDASSRGIAPPVVTTLEPDAAQYYFQLACVNCQSGRQQRAAREIRRGVKRLKSELTHATATGKVALKRSIRELEQLAAAMEGGANNGRHCEQSSSSSVTVTPRSVPRRFKC